MIDHLEETHKTLADIDTIMAGLTALRSRLAGNLKITSSIGEVRAHLCSGCGLRFRSKVMLQHHLWRSHEGPVPDDMVETERRAGE